MALFRYIVRRTLQTFPLLLIIISITFVLTNAIPGDPARILLGPNASPEQVAVVQRRYGLDQPIYVRYYRYLLGVLQGDLGTSITYGVPVTQKILERLPITIFLVATSFALAILTSVPLGIVSALNRNSRIDHVSRIVSLVGVSTPSFWIGLLLIIGFAYHLNWLPANGLIMPWWSPDQVDSASTRVDVLLECARHLILPMITLGTLRMAAITRIERSTMLDVYNRDFIQLAKAYGVSDRKIATKHAFRNAQLPVVTIIGMDLTTALGGAVLTEFVFNINGMGRLIIGAVNAQDYPLVMGTTLTFGVMFLIGVVITDVMYAYIDPRVTYDGE